MSKDIIERMRVAFRAEVSELLAELDTALLTLETEPGNSELINRVFRSIHTIKGSGATAGFRHLARVAHRVEEAFELARSGRLAITPELVDCSLNACDLFHAIIDADDPETDCPGEQELIETLSGLLPSQEPQPEERTAAEASRSELKRSAFEVIFRPHRELFYSGTDPITLLDELRELGQAHIAVQSDQVPLFFDLEAESCYLWWNIKLVTDRTDSAIREVFSFVEDECDLSVRLLEDQTSSVALLGAIPADSLEQFAIECQEHLEEIERYVLELEESNSSRESLDALFRAVHSVKGNAGLLLGQVTDTPLSGSHPLPILARIAHAVESALEPLRQDSGRSVDSGTVGLVLQARDAMHGLLESLLAHADAFIPPPPLMQQLGIESEPPPDARSAAGVTAFRNTAVQCLEIVESCLRQLADGQAGEAVLKTYQRGLKTLGAAAAYQKRSDLNEPIAAQLRILEAAVRAGRVLTPEDRTELDESFRSTRSKVGESASPAPPDEKPKAVPTGPGQGPSATIRIDQEKLDRLMRVVGELLVAKGAFPSLVSMLSRGDDHVAVERAIKEAGASISHIAEELQASVMAIRMLPVKTVFQRFPRLVRDLARSLGKEVQLTVKGESTELDKTILEQIGDPLVHLVRNAIDHGLERPEERQRLGKNPCGRVTLRAATEAGNVVIEVEDDGRGLDAEALKRKAVEKGLLTPDVASAMSPVEACRLVFLPGLSTAKKVTDVSGRGVGMDVVRNNIRNLQGTIDIRTPAQGTVFSIKLPTSLIISKGILLESGGQEYILPLGSIRDMVKIRSTELHEYRGHRITRVRGEVYSVFSLAEIFGLPVQPAGELPIAVIETGKIRYGLIADRFVSEVEVLVKPLSGGLEHCKEFHGAAIMGDGRVVLVLNPLECHRLEVMGGR